jgi:uncharacterized glyoxalase superfamily protein PhnB
MGNLGVPKPTVIPTLRYEDARAAIEWLKSAFGFKEHMVVPGRGDKIAHAQLTLGNGMIMLGSSDDDEFGHLQKPPNSITGPVYQSLYIITAEIEKHYERALAAGAKIAMPLKTEDYGGRSYSCWDPEGHLWNFGSYDPWSEQPD